MTTDQNKCFNSSLEVLLLPDSFFEEMLVKLAEKANLTNEEYEDRMNAQIVMEKLSEDQNG